MLGNNSDCVKKKLRDPIKQTSNVEPFDGLKVDGFSY